MKKVPPIPNEEYWKNYKKPKTINWVTLGEARTKSGLQLQILKSAIKDGLIDQNLQELSYKGNPKISLEQTLKVAKGWKLAEQGGEKEVQLLFKDFLMDKEHWFIGNVQNAKMGKTVTKIQVDYLWKLFNDYFSDEYDIVPKNIPLEEKLKKIKESEATNKDQDDEEE